jgi:uncharacterized membrane protein
MPGLLELYLSPFVILILLGLYLLGTLLVLIGFRQHRIQRRKDVILRSSLMHGTYIFMSHGCGLIIYSILYIMLMINGASMQNAGHLMIVLVSMLLSNGIYYMAANYLWSRFSISRKNAIKMTHFFMVFVTPWYFLLA